MYYVIDEISGKWMDISNCLRIAIDESDTTIVFGYVHKSNMVQTALIKNRYYLICLKVFKGTLSFDSADGNYFSTLNKPRRIVITKTHRHGMNSYPYTFKRNYEAVNLLKLFRNKQEILDRTTNYRLAQVMPYTFGIEFEASQGLIPEDICFRDGLIPLRDGSISSCEYSTIILKENEGISLLKQQMDTLQKYVYFNKDCSLHVHIGGFPLEPDKIFNLYKILYHLEPEIMAHIPELSFRTSEFKSNRKDYCKRLKDYCSFNMLYLDITGRTFFGSLEQAHPNDPDRSQKWKILSRYRWCNMVNMLCYNVNKTVEFRFLRPTYNFKKLVLWLYIFNGIMQYAEHYEDSVSINLRHILCLIYPDSLTEELMLGWDLLKLEAQEQANNGDQIGSEFWRDNMFDCLEI